MGDGSLRLVIAFLWALAVSGQTDPEPQRDHHMMIILNEDNFQRIINQYQVVLVQFYVPWCGHCKKFSHELTKASDLTRSTNQSIVFGILNADQHENIANAYNVHNFPSLRLFLNKTMIAYEGPKDFEFILAWVSARMETGAQMVNSTAQIHSFLNNYSSVLSVIGPTLQELELLHKVARMSQDTAVVYAPSASDGSKTIDTKAKVTIYRRWYKEKVFEDWLLSEDTLLEFVEKYKHKPVSNFDEQESLDRVFNEAGASLVFFANNNSDSFTPRFHQIAEEHQHQLKAFLVSSRDKYGRELRDYLGIGPEMPRRAVFMLITTNTHSTNNFRLMERISGWNLQMFIKRWQNGRLDDSFANLTDEQIILDLNHPNVHQRLQTTNSTCCVLNFMGEECERTKSCRIRLRKFGEFASRLFLIKRLEFCYLNFDRGYQFTKGEYYDYMRAPMPAISLTLRGTERKAVFVEFDWKFESLLLWLKSELPEDLATALIKAF